MPPRHSSSPSWFRYAVVAAAVLVLCSCRTTEPIYRVAEGADDSLVAAAVPGTTRSRRDDQVRPAVADIPLTLTDDQLEQATDLTAGDLFAGCGPDGCYAAPCGPGGCACCNQGPIRGPDDEYLCDGGDFGTPAAVVTGGDVVGLEQEDAVAHYDTVDGRTVITPSNKVCLYAPRFAAVRQVVDLRALARVDALQDAVRNIAPAKIDEDELAATSLARTEPNIHRVKDPPSLLRERQQGGELARERRVAATLGTLAPYCDVQLVRTGEVIGVERAVIARSSLAAITWAGDQAAQVLLDSRQAQADVSVKTPGTIYLLIEPNNPKLRLVKLASTDSAKPGEDVEFTLRFDNVGDRIIGNVAILDSLTTRLEYVEGSQKCSLEADFTTRPNEGDSLKLRWEIRDPLKPGEGGVIQFRCRVR